MREHRLSGSKLSLARSCSYWAAPSCPLPVREDTSRYALAGRAFHYLTELHKDNGAIDFDKAMEVVIAFGLNETDAEGAVANYELARDFLDKVPSHAAVEVPFAYDTANDSARVLPGTGVRDYSTCTATEIPCTVDIWWAEGDVAVVADWETGWQQYKGDVRDSLQLAFGGLCAARVAGLERARIEIWRPHENGVHVDAHHLDLAELDGIGMEIGMLLDDLNAPDIAPQGGTHCHQKFCGALGTCPEAEEAVDEAEAVVVGKNLPVKYEEPLSMTLRDAEHVMLTLFRLKKILAACKALRGACCNWVDENGCIDLGDGKLWGPHEVPKYDIVMNDETMAILEEHGDIDLLAPRKTTKTLLKKSLGTKGMFAVWDELKAAGLITDKKTTKHEEFASG